MGETEEAMEYDQEHIFRHLWEDFLFNSIPYQYIYVL